MGTALKHLQDCRHPHIICALPCSCITYSDVCVEPDHSTAVGLLLMGRELQSKSNWKERKKKLLPLDANYGKI